MRLNKASITGFFCCFGTILFGIATNGGIKTILNFLHVPSLIVTMGGTLFAVMITSDSLDDFIIGVKGLPYAFTRSMANASEIITSIYDLSETARKEGLLALEEKAVQVTHPHFEWGWVTLIWRSTFFSLTAISCYSHSSNSTSDGNRKSPLGLTDTVPTLTPSGIQFRLNC